MTNILQNPKGISHANDHMLLQNQEAEKVMGSGFTAGSTMYGFKKSLNREARKRELMKITREN